MGYKDYIVVDGTDEMEEAAQRDREILGNYLKYVKATTALKKKPLSRRAIKKRLASNTLSHFSMDLVNNIYYNLSRGQKDDI